MTLYQFKEAFKRGLGSAILELKNSDNRDKYKDTVLWCCLHNTCYDMQCEGQRGEYLYTTIKCFEDKTYFEQAIIKKYQQKEIDSWILDQLSSLLCKFAADGSQNAREALYQKLEFLLNKLIRIHKHNTLWNDRSDFEWLCIWLTTLDGFKAFKYIVTGIGRYYEKTKVQQMLYLDWFYSNSKNKFGEKRVINYLEKQAGYSEGVAIFLKETQEFENIIERKRELPPSLEEYIEYCREKKFGYTYKTRLFALYRSKEDLTALAKAAVMENDQELSSAMLRPFRISAFPLDKKYIFELAESENEDVRENALTILENLISDEVHDYAVKLLNEGKEIGSAIILLAKNYRESDKALLLKSIKEAKVKYNDGNWHRAYMAIEDIYSNKKYKPNINILLYIYRNTLCSWCRSRIVEIMYKRKVLPEEILEECLYDSYDETRALAERIVKKQSDKN